MAHPYHHSLSSVKKWGGAVEDYQRIHDWFDESKKIIADFRARGKCDALDAHEIGHAIQVRLRLRAQFIVHRDQHVLAAEQVEPGLEM